MEFAYGQGSLCLNIRRSDESELRPCIGLLYSPSNLHFAVRTPNKIN